MCSRQSQQLRPHTVRCHLEIHGEADMGGEGRIFADISVNRIGQFLPSTDEIRHFADGAAVHVAHGMDVILIGMNGILRVLEIIP